MPILFSQNIRSLLRTLRPLDALLPCSLVLHLYKTNSALSQGLLLIWVAIRFLEPVFQNRGKVDSRHLGTAYALFTGLLLFQAHTIAIRADKVGFSQYLMVAIGLAVGFTLNLKAWRILLQWMNIATLSICTVLLSHFQSHEMWIGIIQGDGIMSSVNDEIFAKGYGGINRIATMLCLLTIASWASARLSKSRFFQILGGLGTCIGYFTCLASESRMAAIAPITGIIISWLIIHGRSLLRSSNRKNLIIRAILILGPFFAIGTFVVGSDLDVGFSGDLTRLKLIRCWLSSVYKTKISNIVWGNSREKVMSLCSNNNIGNADDTKRAIGHAHNTFAHITGLHGLFGIIAICILIIVIYRGMISQILHSRITFKSISSNPITNFSWGEACLGFNLTILICSLTTTIHIYNHVNQLLIGLLLSASLAPPLTARNTRPCLPPEPL